MALEHAHQWVERGRSENTDRIRTHDDCDCGAVRYGVFAHRLDDDGQMAWGPVGQWAYKVEERTSGA